MSFDAMRWAWEDVRERITPTEKLVLIALANHADERGVSTTSISNIESRTLLNERTIQRALVALAENGWIKKHERLGAPSVFKLALSEMYRKPELNRGGRPRKGGDTMPPPSDQGGDIGGDKRGDKRGDTTPPIPRANIQEPKESAPALLPHEPPAKPDRKKAAHQITEDWHPGPQGVEYARRLGLDPDREREKLVAWALGKGEKKADWLQAWRGWCLRAAEGNSRFGKGAVPKVRWEDCAINATPPNAPPQADGFMPRLREMGRLREEAADRRLDPYPAWMDAPRETWPPVAQQMADMDAWIIETCRRARRPIPAISRPAKPEQPGLL